MTACAVQKHLSPISYGMFRAYKEPQPFIGDLCKSLPPLPGYIIPGLGRSRCSLWGEDDGRAHFGYTRYRNSYDFCHPIPDNPEYLKHQGYMFPKPNELDLTVLRHPSTNARRRVPRDSTWEVFPKNNASRLQDGRSVLGDATRRAIEDNGTRLYRTTRTSSTFQDTSDFMMAKAQRDAQYRLSKGIGYIETPTCSRIHNHPDPCHYCWYGGCNKDFETKLAEFQSKLYDSDETGYVGGKTENTSAQKDDLDHAHKNNFNTTNGPGILETQTQVCGCLNDTCSICMKNKTGMDTRIGVIQGQGENAKADDKTNECAQAVNKDTFGPWQDSLKETCCTEEPPILTNNYRFKLPSSAYCQYAQHEYESDLISQQYKPIPFDQRELLWRANEASTKEQRAHNYMQEVPLSFVQPVWKQKSLNSWTNRDENNLRIPCITDIIGSSRKTDAHKRYHLEHPELVSDLRDNRSLDEFREWHT